MPYARQNRQFKIQDLLELRGYGGYDGRVSAFEFALSERSHKRTERGAGLSAE